MQLALRQKSRARVSLIFPKHLANKLLPNCRRKKNIITSKGWNFCVLLGKIEKRSKEKEAVRKEEKKGRGKESTIMFTKKERKN